MEKDNLNNLPQQRSLSGSASRVLNYVKKHNCRIRMRWYCGIQVHKVWKENKELLYPHINEDIWCEISEYFKQDGDYQHTHFYDLNGRNPQRDRSGEA